MGRLTDAGPRSNGPWVVGETRNIGGFDGVNVTRTSREYAYDLCDAYNERLRKQNRHDVAWFVAPDGSLKMGTPFEVAVKLSKWIEGRKENERREWKRRRHEAEMAHRSVGDDQ